MSRRASSYTRKLIEWLWFAHFAIGMLGLIDGDPSRGKSQILASMAGHITTGRPWPDGTPCPLGGVVIVGAEDPIAEVWIPRLQAAGADLDRVTILPSKDDGTPLRLPEDTPYLEKEVREVDARMLAFDPIMSCLTGLTNPNSDKDVRQALTPLNEMLVRNSCGGVMLRHHNKNDKVSSALYRGMASIAFGALARTAFAVAKDPDSPGGFVFAPTKNNIARYPASLKYRIADVDLGEGFNTSRIEWQGESQRTAEELVTAFGAEASKAADAEQLLAQWLADGPVLSDVLKDRCEEAGISFRTYRRVKEEVLRCGAGQHKGHWYSFLPEHQRLFELMRTQMVMGDEWNAPLSSGVQPTRSGVQNAQTELAGVQSTGPSRARAHEDNLFGHLISSDGHLTKPEVQVSKGQETTRAHETPDDYGEALMAEPDLEDAEVEV
ncbi:MAG: AAA family ATPase [Candidatus Dormibacterales bacterium]